MKTMPLRLEWIDCSIDLATCYPDSGVAVLLDQLNQDLIGLRPVKI